MPHIVSQEITITINKLVKEGSTDKVDFLDSETIKQLEEVVQQLVEDKSVVVEASSSSEVPE